MKEIHVNKETMEMLAFHAPHSRGGPYTRQHIDPLKIRTVNFRGQQ
jgi:hypothetical protein